MIEVWAEKLAVLIKKSNEKETASVAVMKYALIIVINFLIPYTSALIFGWITGKFVETLICVFAIVLVRAVSGGYHFQSVTVCSIVTFLAASLPPHLSFPQEAVIYVNGISFILFALLAPANIKGYARMPEKFFLIMKGISLVIVGGNLILQLPLLTMVFALQALSLLFPFGKGVTTRQ